MEDNPQPDLRHAIREVGQELSRAAEQADRMVRQACEDLARLVGDPRRSRPADAHRESTEESPVDVIRQLAGLRNEGLITDDEFAAKKAELLRRI